MKSPFGIFCSQSSSELTTEDTEVLEVHLGTASGSLCIRVLRGFFRVFIIHINKLNP